MGQQQSQPEAGAEGTSGEDAAAAEGEDTSAAGAEAADTGASAGDAGAAAEGAEGEQGKTEEKPEPTEEEKAAAEKAEGELKAAAEKYAKDLISQANRTMAAARRAQKAAEDAAKPLQAELATAKHEAKIYGDFVRELQTAPMAALARLGFKTFKDFAAFVVEAGGDGKPQSEEERIAALLDKKLEERDAPRKQAEKAAQVAEAKKQVFAYIDAQTERFDLVTTDIGHDRLWKGIEAYHKQHGVVPDAAIDLIADKVEKELAASLGKSKKFGQRQPGNNGASADGKAAPAASTSGKPLAGKPTSSAPAPRKYSLNDDERTAQINEELRREGIL